MIAPYCTLWDLNKQSRSQQKCNFHAEGIETSRTCADPAAALRSLLQLPPFWRKSGVFRGVNKP